MRKIIVLAVMAIVIISCGRKSTSRYETAQDSIDEQHYVDSAMKNLDEKNRNGESKNIISYEIISEKEHVDPKYGFNKCNIEVVLKEKISKDDLIFIANQIRETRQKYDKLWIFYNLKGAYSGSGCWATTHFTPNLNVEIIGSTIETDKKYKSSSSEKNIIGKWIINGAYSYMLILFKKEKTLYMKKQFDDGSSGQEIFIKSKIKGKTCYKPKNNPENLYYIIDSKGNLNLYGEHGKFADANKIE